MQNDLLCVDQGTGGISVHWNQIALAALPEDADVAETAQLFAILNSALFDGRIAYFTVKYRDLTWRPITAIRCLHVAYELICECMVKLLVFLLACLVEVHSTIVSTLQILASVIQK